MTADKPTYEELENQIAELKKQNEILKLIENSDKISDSKYRKMIGNIGDVIVIIDSKGVNKYKSHNIEKYFGWKPEELIGKSTFENVHADDLEFLQNNIATLITDPNAIKTFEIRYKCKDGTYKWIEFTCRNLLRDPDINGILGNYHDITEHKQTKEFLQGIIDKNPMSIQLVDMEGYTLQINAAHTKLFGAVPPSDYSIFNDLQLIDQNFGELLDRVQKGEVIYFPDFQYNAHQVNPDFPDWPVWIRMVIFPILNSDNTPNQFVLMHEDITKRKLAEIALIDKQIELKSKVEEYETVNEELQKAKEKAEESETQLRNIANNFSDGMIYQLVTLDENTRKFNYVSDAVTKFYGCTPEQVKENPDLIYSKIHPNDLSQLIEDEKEALKNMSVFRTECRVINPDGSIRWSYYVSQPRLINNNVCWDGMEVDITKRKQNDKEKAEESDKLKTEFINNMSHEIRTPMNGILGFSNFLNEEDLSTEKQKHYIKIIQNSGNQLMRIIDNILEISKLGTKQVVANEKEICLNDILLGLFSIFDIKAKENKTPLYLKKGFSDNNSLIFTDETKLNKILSNLLENALKFTNEGFIEFGYQLKNDELEFFVTDTGIGIAIDKQETIFERFSQEEKELSKNVGGLGLGLSIAKENAELLGGKITLKSEKGKGATFLVTIPYKPVISETEIYNFENNDYNLLEKQDEYTILIVEDEEVNYLYLETLIENIIEFNSKILHAKNGKEAIEICKFNSKINIVLMDLKMPIMNGFDATKLIKELRSDLPIIAQTAYTTNEDKEKAFTAGCDDFISKPISEETLNEILNKYLINK